MPQDVRIARNEKQLDFSFASPLSKYQRVNNLMAHSIDDSDYFTDTWSEQMLVNHNLYTYHRYSIDACDLVFNESKKDLTRVPADIVEMAELIESYLTTDNADEIEDKLTVLMEPFMRKGKDESHIDDSELT
mgnify:CR=1 FL=1